MDCEKTFYALGTQNALFARGADAEKALDAVTDRVTEIDERMSAFRPESEVSAIAREAGKKAVPVDKDVYFVLKKSLYYAKASGGAFDCTLRPLTALWNFSHSEIIPEKEKIDSLLGPSGCVGSQNLILSPWKRTAFLKVPGGSVDLGGIAKGYAADEAVRILHSFGITDALINFGGNVAAMGKTPQNTSWKIGIQNPLEERGVAVLELDLKNCSAVTSAVNEQFYIRDGCRYHHLLDPATGYPAQSGLLSVTVIDRSSMKADALSTAAFVLGAEKGAALIHRMHARAVFIQEDGKIFSTFPLPADCTAF